MILKRIEIEQFGGLRDYVLDLAPGFQYLYGENEAGKSTLCAFLTAMLYGLKKERGAGLSGDMRSLYMPWHETYMAGTLYFEAEGKDYILKRRFGKTAKGDHCSLYLAENWQEVTLEGNTIGERFLGIGEDAFRKTLFIGQSGAAFSKGKEDELMERLLSLEQSGDEDTSLQKALSELSRAGTELVSKTGRGGALVQLAGDIEKLKIELFEAKQRNASFATLLEDIKSLSAEKDAAEKEMSALEEQKKEAMAFSQYQIREEKRGSGRALIERKENEEKALLKVQETLSPLLSEQAALAGHYMPDQSGLLELVEKESKCAALEEKEQERKALEEDIKALEEQMVQAPAPKKSKKGLFFGLAGLMTILSFVFLPLSLVLLLPAIVLLILGLHNPQNKEVEKEQLLLKLKIEEKQKQLDEMSKEDYAGKLSAIRAELATVFTAAGVESIASLSKKAETMRALFDRVDDLKQDEARLKESLQSLETTISTLTLPPEEEPVRYDGPSEEELERRLAVLRNEQMERERTLAQMNAKVTEGFSASRSISAVENDLAQAEEKHRELSERYDAIELARKTLEECSDELKKTFAPALDEKLCALITRLTGGRYTQIKVTDDYGLLIQTPDGHEIVEADFVSAGTYDILYFALRVAVLQTLYEKIPLLILDDTFIQMDENRQKAAFSLLSEPIAEQVLYFSCHKPQGDITVHTLS